MTFSFHAHARLMKSWNTGKIPRLHIFLNFLISCSLPILIIIIFGCPEEVSRAVGLSKLSTQN